MAHFVEGIKNFESMGAPDLHGPVMTWEDMQFATKMNRLEFENYSNQEMEFFDEKHEDYPEVTKEDYEEFLYDKNIDCGACGKALEEASINSDLSRSLNAITNEAEVDGNLAAALFSAEIRREL